MQKLHHFIVNGYDREELRALCLHLRINHDALPGEGTVAKARELLLYLGRQRQLDQLLAVLRRAHSQAFEEAGLGEVTPETLYAALTCTPGAAPLVGRCARSRKWPAWQRIKNDG